MWKLERHHIHRTLSRDPNLLGLKLGTYLTQLSLGALCLPIERSSMGRFPWLDFVVPHIVLYSFHSRLSEISHIFHQIC
jgi:hypothetical protein